MKVEDWLPFLEQLGEKVLEVQNWSSSDQIMIFAAVSLILNCFLLQFNARCGDAAKKAGHNHLLIVASLPSLLAFPNLHRLFPDRTKPRYEFEETLKRKEAIRRSFWRGLPRL